VKNIRASLGHPRWKTRTSMGAINGINTNVLSLSKIKTMAATITIPEKAIVNILKDLPENILRNIFWKTFVSYDDSPLTDIEKKSLAKAKLELKKGETIKWQGIK
jgi:hypothetical protein